MKLKTWGSRSIQRGGLMTSCRAAILMSIVGIAIGAGEVRAQGASAGGAQPASKAAGTAPVCTTISYVISNFDLEFDFKSEVGPRIEDLLNLPVTLGVLTLADGTEAYCDPNETVSKEDKTLVHPGIPTKTITVGESFGEKGHVFLACGVGAVSQAIASELIDRRKLVGVNVVPSLNDINWGTGADKRKGTLRFKLMIYTGHVTGIEVLNQSPDVEGEDRKNPDRLMRIAQNDEIRPGDLIYRDLLDDYMLRLNRRPGRRINAAIIPGRDAKDPSGVDLQYQISEAARPFTFYAQIANIGTKTTGDWRERFGFVHNNLTNADDVFRFDYLTAEFDSTNAVSGSYERPFMDNQMRARAYGSWSQFTADSVGIANFTFKGENIDIGAEFEATVFQRGAYFIDVFTGVKWDSVKVNNPTLGQRARQKFLIPYAGVKFEHATDVMHTNAAISIETTQRTWTGNTNNELTTLGRIFPDSRFTVIHYNFDHTMYLEPLLYSAEALNEDRTRATLAHEVSISIRGQEAFNYRLIPSYEGVAGGFYSVRGYPESVVSGDNSIVASAEYRFHLPRVLMTTNADGKATFIDPASTGGFRVGPTGPFDRADWDWIFRGFVDAGNVRQNRIQSFERNRTLIGAGVGTELQFKQNVQLRLDWAFALRDTSGTENVKAGDSRLHFSATFLY